MDAELIAEVVKTGGLAGGLGVLWMMISRATSDALRIRTEAHQAAEASSEKRIADLEEQLAAERTRNEQRHSDALELRVMTAARIGTLEAAVRHVLANAITVDDPAGVALDDLSRRKLADALAGK